MLILRGHEVRALLDAREADVLNAVRRAYVLHAEGKTAVPHSTFLRFPGDTANRVIALPAYLEDGGGLAGMKWISSFPGNVRSGLERASAVIVLNSASTGHPEAVIEGSVISARRTGASAALAAGALQPGPQDGGISLIGCGVINFDVLRFVAASRPGLDKVTLYDVEPASAERFRERCLTCFPDLDIRTATDASSALAAHGLVSIATTATTPHLGLDAARAGSLVLHVSLRDLTPRAILAARNVVDDADHVCRARTSLELAEQMVGHRDFIDGTLGDLLRGGQLSLQPRHVTVFSPFGLAILDLAVAGLARDRALAEGAGTWIPDFLPTPSLGSGRRNGASVNKQRAFASADRD